MAKEKQLHDRKIKTNPDPNLKRYRSQFYPTFLVLTQPCQCIVHVIQCGGKVTLMPIPFQLFSANAAVIHLKIREHLYTQYTEVLPSMSHKRKQIF